MKAFLFDLNGTMINDMDYHTRAWQRLLNEDLGCTFTWEQVKAEMYGKNQEVLVRLLGPDRLTEAQMQTLSLQKEQHYQQEYRPHLALLPGLSAFLAEARQQQLLLAIGSAAIPFNINFVLDTLGIRSCFQAIVSADDVSRSKPDPETFLRAAGQLGVAPADCLVFEDVPKGAEAARNAGMPAIILTTTHQPAEFSHLDNIRHFAPDFQDEYLRALVRQAEPATSAGGPRPGNT